MPGDKYFSDDFGTDIGNKGIESHKTSQKCPAWSKSSWLSWVGVGAWEKDDNLRIKCQDGQFLFGLFLTTISENETCFVSEYFCARFKSTGSLTECVDQLSQCEAFDRQLCTDQNQKLKNSCFYGKCD